MRVDQDFLVLADVVGAGRERVEDDSADLLARDVGGGERRVEVFGKLDGICKPGAVLATNTSYLNIDQIASAKAVCGECDAQSECLEFALATNQDSGVWGGTSEEERRKLRKAWLARRRKAS